MRLGAIYALEQVATESRQQHQPAMEVLCAFLRERAAWDPQRPAATRLPTDVQAVLTVLGRRTAACEDGTPSGSTYAAPTCAAPTERRLLRAAPGLFEAHLETATMQAARLAHADLRGAWLNNADLVEADLRAADLRERTSTALTWWRRASRAPISAAPPAGRILGGASLQGRPRRCPPRRRLHVQGQPRGRLAARGARGEHHRRPPRRA
ncbi:MAG: pentapeptide repeat-containing protein [Candidatus Binatia bacterium]